MAMETDQLVSLVQRTKTNPYPSTIYLYPILSVWSGVKQCATKYLGFLIFIKKSKGGKKEGGGGGGRGEEKNNTMHQTRIPETTNSCIVIPTLWLLCIPGMDHWPPLLSINHCQSWLRPQSVQELHHFVSQ